MPFPQMIIAGTKSRSNEISGWRGCRRSSLHIGYEFMSPSNSLRCKFNGFFSPSLKSQDRSRHASSNHQDCLVQLFYAAYRTLPSLSAVRYINPGVSLYFSMSDIVVTTISNGISTPCIDLYIICEVFRR